MSFDPREQRDKSGKWVSGIGASARTAATWLKSDEAKAAISKLSAPDTIKTAATMAIQSALFNMGVNDPHIDQAVSHHVKSFAANAQITRAHARQLMLTAVKALIKVRA